jgi:hypothetical protein
MHKATVVSYPKSGRTWLRYIFSLAGVEADFTHAGYATGGHRIGTRFSGLACDFDAPEAGKVLVLVRDPLDTAVSLYFQIHRRELPVGSGLRRVRRSVRLAVLGRTPPTDIGSFVLSERHGVEKVIRFNRACIAALPGRERGLVVAYEDLHRDFLKTIGAVLAFIDPALPLRVDLCALAERASFEAMHSMEASGTGDWRMSPVIPGDPESFKTRRGKVGGFRDYLDHETVEAARAIYRRLGQPWIHDDGEAGA